MLTNLYSNALTGLLFEKSEDFVGIYDLSDERFVRVNRAGVQMLGFPSEQALLSDPVRSRSLRTPPLQGPYLTKLIERITQAGKHEEMTRIERQDGQFFWGRISINTFTDNGGSFALIRLTDQGRLFQAERELDHSLRRYEAIFSNAAIGIIVCDEQGKIVSANQLADEQFGYGTGELTLLTIEQVVPTGVGHYHEKLRQSFNTTPQVRVMGRNRDLHAQRKDGSIFPVEISLSYFLLEADLYAVAYIIDITLKKQAEQQLLAHRDDIERLNADLEHKVADRTHALMETLDQLKQSKDELARALVAEQKLGELKSRFVSMASHEFRTPLTVLQTSATLVEKYAGVDQQDKRKKHLDRIQTSVKHLNDILEEFLSVGKIEAGRVDAQPADVDMAQLVSETVADMQGILKPGQTVQTHLSCPAPVWLDPSLLRKILVNLLANAVKYSGPGSVVTMRTTCAEGRLTLSVQDEGIGIPIDDQQHLFERFFRAGNVANIAGTGLGLHIVGRYVDLMGGTVSLHSVLDQGTIVTLILPCNDHSAD
ncbi:MAG: PAS domain S-box protein [Bacteroidetes bacterium]|nr:PAS domain S-box protein [Fibrella sp.]